MQVWKIQVVLLCVVFIKAIACRNQDTVENFRNLHSSFAFGGSKSWDEASNVKLNEMCSKMLSEDGEATFAIWDTEDYYENRPRQETFNFDTEGQFQAHLQQVRKCCKKVSTFDKKLCFKAMRENFFDSYCQKNINDKCCRTIGNPRYQCFSRKRESQIPLEYLETDDVRPLPSGIKVRLGPALLPEDQQQQQTDAGENDNQQSEIFPETDLNDEEEEDSQCLAEYFPETEVDTMTESVGNEVCTNDDILEGDNEVSKRRREAVACCRIGAFVGRKYVKKGCPYLKCKKFYAMFAKKHRKCIKHKRLCGFAFVACCERQHHKDFYLGYQHPETDSDFGQMIN